MKKLLLPTALMLCCAATYASDFTVGGIYYNVLSTDDKTVEVTAGEGYTGDITIPATVTAPDSGIEYSVTAIGDQAFDDCSSLKSIIIPGSVTSIGNFAFYVCEGLKSVTIPASVTSMGEYAFGLCDALETVDLQANLKQLPSGAFWFCSKLSTISLPESLTGIGETAFSFCEQLKSIDIPAGVTSIGGLAFASCTSITSPTLPTAITTIGEMAFANCTSITSITLPAAVTTIGEMAFYGCSLTAATSLNPTPPTADEDIFSTSDGFAIYVPAASVDAYKSAWSGYANYISAIQTSGIDSVTVTADNDAVNCFTPQGLRVKSVRTTSDIRSLSPGLYIINGQKVKVE